MSKVKYDWDYKPDLKDLPDPQVTCAIEGANVPIQKVGINEFEAPINFLTRNGDAVKLKSNISAYVSLGSGTKGINMSRLVRVMYDHLGKDISLVVMKNILRDYKDKLGSNDSYLKFRFDYPIKQRALRSGLEGWQYYTCELEGRLDAEDEVKYFLTVNFIYSSACPCSYELAQQSFIERSVPSISHSQRSDAQVTIELDSNSLVYVEDVVELLRDALQTEVQVMVKREDEQAFAELNGLNQKFVEDAARLIHEQLDVDSRIKDFVAVCNHYESLHGHNAVSVIYKGVPGGLR